MKLVTTCLLLSVFLSQKSFGQDTTVVQTFTFDSIGRVYSFDFPDGLQTYRKVLMQYRMRCKGGLVSTGSNTNLGCGEWDYSCNTYLTDESQIDSLKATHPNYLISGFNGTTFNYSLQPTYNYYTFDQTETVINNTASENISIVGSGTVLGSSPFNFSESAMNKTQLLFTASELISSGIIASNINGLQLNLSALGSNPAFMQIRMKHTPQTTLSSVNPELIGFQEVYFWSPNFSAIGLQDLHFSAPFAWNGTDNIIIEISYTNSDIGTDASVLSDGIGSDVVLTKTASDRYALCDGTGMGKGTIDNFTDLTNYQEITIEGWVKPTSFSNGNYPTVFSFGRWGLSLGFASNGGGTLETWINNSVGIQSTLTAPLNQWSHIALVYNASTNTSTFYINGQPAGTGSAPALNTAQGTDGRLGYADIGTDSYSKYEGGVDDLRIWGAALSTSTIQNYMYKSVDGSHPNASAFLSSYDFDAADETQTPDNQGNSSPIVFESGIHKNDFRGIELFKGFNAIQVRPQMYFKQGNYTITNTVTTVMDSVVCPGNVVESYAVNGTDLQQTGTAVYYESGYTYIYNYETGELVDSVLVATDGSISISNLNYFEKYPSKLELMSFVTPYGIGLDLGTEGKMWEFDVTDFTPVLRGTKQISIEFWGANQEELDIRFLFISGTPPRDVLAIQNVWKSDQLTAYTDLMVDTYFEPRNISIDNGATMFKWRTDITGHGQEGEFIPRTHYLNVNGGTKEMQWQVWKECGKNPIYPQGGTWIYDRAGWCPGAPTDLLEYEISSSMVNGGILNLDYGLNGASGTSNYYISSMLVSYGDPNFSNDASVVEVKQPSSKTEYMRINPWCAYPVVTIQNTGSNDLTTLNISYQVAGGTAESYSWTGNLGFMESEEVTLPISGPQFWIGNNTNEFIVTLGSDEYADNNTMRSHFDLSDVYTENFVITLKTNNNPEENSYVIKDETGAVVFSKNGSTANTIYRDTMNLASGCYVLELTDSGGDGLSFWNNASQGNGYLHFKSISGSQILKTFEADFGTVLTYSFTLSGNISVPELIKKELTFDFFPNPTSGELTIHADSNMGENLQVEIRTIQGQSIIKRQMQPNKNMVLDLSDYASGMYQVVVFSSTDIVVKNIIIK